MNVKVVSITQSLIEGVNTAEELIVYAARVSNPSNQMNMATSDRLISFLIRKKHWSPFEQAHFGVEVKTSRAIAAQILRHWTIAVQEFSQRYAEAVEFEPVELRKNGATNRQSSTEVFDPEIIDPNGPNIVLMGENGPENKSPKILASVAIREAVSYLERLYKSLLGADVAKESARMILPLTTQTTMYLTGDLRTWIHYLMQRTSEHAQKEHRLVANEIEVIFQLYFPDIFKAVERLKRQEAAFEEWLKTNPVD